MSYIIKYWRPLSGLVIGLLLVILFCLLYTRWRKKPVQWIAKHIFRNQFMSEKSADGLYNVLISFIPMIGGLWIVSALLYLGVL
jgi:ethanolamine transporter EutH